MSIPLSDDIKRLIDGRNFAHLATVMSDGSPQSAPVWVGREGERIIVVTEEKSLKARNTRRDPRVAISIVDTENPYIEAQMRGRVAEWRPDTNLAYTDLISQKYVGQTWPYRETVAVALFIEVDKAHYEKQPFEHVPLGSQKKPA
jgi:PPOX class probable F420-dependent enzyme